MICALTVGERLLRALLQQVGSVGIDEEVAVGLATPLELSVGVRLGDDDRVAPLAGGKRQRGLLEVLLVGAEVACHGVGGWCSELESIAPLATVASDWPPRAS